MAVCFFLNDLVTLRVIITGSTVGFPTVQSFKSTHMIKKSILLICFAVTLNSHAAPHEDEIQFLIDSIGKDGCRFLRNDRRYSSREARAHLQSKYELNAHYVASAEDFINKIASRSETTGDAYQIRCRDQAELPAADWFSMLLMRYRADQSTGAASGA